MKEYQLYPTLAGVPALRSALTRLRRQGVTIEHVAVAGHLWGDRSRPGGRNTGTGGSSP